MRDTERAILAIMAGQLDLVTRAQILAVGGSSRTIDRLCAPDGLLVRVHQGVFRRRHARFDHEAACLAAQLYVEPRGPLAGGFGFVRTSIAERSAAHLAGLVPDPPPEVVVAVTAPRTVRVAGIRSRQLGPFDVDDLQTLPSGVVVTRPALTLLHLSSVLDDRDLEDAYEQAERRRMVNPRVVARVLRCYDAQRRSRLRAFVADRPDLLPPTESQAELDLERLLADFGFPAPTRQFWVATPDGRRYRLDFAWPDLRLGLELDSRRWHAASSDEARDNRRDVDLHLLGWHVVRVRTVDVRRNPVTALDPLARVFRAHTAA